MKLTATLALGLLACAAARADVPSLFTYDFKIPVMPAVQKGLESALPRMMAVPEPGTYGLVGAAGFGAVAVIRRRRKSV